MQKQGINKNKPLENIKKQTITLRSYSILQGGVSARLLVVLLAAVVVSVSFPIAWIILIITLIFLTKCILYFVLNMPKETHQIKSFIKLHPKSCKSAVIKYADDMITFDINGRLNFVPLDEIRCIKYRQFGAYDCYKNANTSYSYEMRIFQGKRIICLKTNYSSFPNKFSLCELEYLFKFITSYKTSRIVPCADTELLEENCLSNSSEDRVYCLANYCGFGKKPASSLFRKMRVLQTDFLNNKVIFQFPNICVIAHYKNIEKTEISESEKELTIRIFYKDSKVCTFVINNDKESNLFAHEIADRLEKLIQKNSTFSLEKRE